MKKRLVVCNIQTSFKRKVFKKLINLNLSMYITNPMQYPTNLKRNNKKTIGYLQYSNIVQIEDF